MNTSAAFERFSHVLSEDGTRAALAFVLGLSEYRFIGIFRFQDGQANAAIHVDRENPSVLQIEEVPDYATYCCYVRNGRGSFITANALVDHRLSAHPARATVRAYCGLPIIDADGELLGTLCHYDLEPRDPARLDMDLLRQVVDELQRGRHVPPYPAVRQPLLAAAEAQVSDATL